MIVQHAQRCVIYSLGMSSKIINVTKVTIGETNGNHSEILSNT